MVVYSVDYDRFRNLKGHVDSELEFERFFAKNRVKFFSLPVSEQIENVLRFLYFRKLSEFQARIAFMLEPRNFENEFVVLFWSNSDLRDIEVELLRKCVEDKKCREEFLRVVDACLKMPAS